MLDLELFVSLFYARSLARGISEAYTPDARGLAGILHRLITDDVTPESRPEDMGGTNNLVFENKARSSHTVIAPRLGTFIQDFAARLFAIDGINDANDIAKPVIRGSLLIQRSRFTFQERHAFSIERFENGLHPIGYEPEVVKKLPIDRGAPQRQVEEQARRLGEWWKASAARRRHQTAPPFRTAIFSICNPGAV